jgi:phytanoyl-CoA hydroxylase
MFFAPSDDDVKSRSASAKSIAAEETHLSGLKTKYIEQGYAVLEGAIPLPALESIRGAAAKIIDEFDISQHRTVFSTKDQDSGRDHYFMESAQAVHCFLEQDALDDQGHLIRPKNLAINKIGHAMHDLVPEFTRFCRQQIVTETLSRIGYLSPLLWQTMYIFKQARIGGEVRWHQDASYLITQPSSVVGFWVALEDSHRDNGCLWVQPGGHRSPLREIYEVDRGSKTGKLRVLDKTPWPSTDEAVAVEVPAGSLVIFNDHMPHYSSHNHSGSSRQAFTMHFSEASTEWAECNWLQRPTLGAFDLLA